MLRSGSTFVAGVILVACWLVVGCAAPTPEQGTEGSEAATNPNPPIHVWLDVDPAIGLPEAEVDDGVMMVQAFHSPELVVEGISVVFGNTSRDSGVPIARDLVRRFGPSRLTVSAGAAGADELGQSTDATEAMASALEQKPLTILAVGPVTNVGSLLLLRPDLAPRIEKIVMVAARRLGQSFRPYPEFTGAPFRDFNFELDPAAMQVVLDSSVPLVFAPWEVSSHVWITDPDLQDLRQRSESGRWISDNVATWIHRWKTNLGTNGFNPFDTLAVAWLTHPDLIESVEVGVWIQDDVDDVDPNSRKPFLYVDPGRDDLRQAVYTFRPDPSFKTILLDRLAGPGIPNE